METLQELYYWNSILAEQISYSTTRDTGIASLINASNNKSAATSTGATTSIFGEDGFTFGDIIDIINPLQHIPIVSNIYRKISGDTIAPAMEIAGGALFGGPLGAAMSLVTTAFQSYMKTDSADPDSPDNDNESTTINSTAIANNRSPALPKSISINDYSLADNSVINQADHKNSPLEKSRSWGLNSNDFNKGITINKSENNHVSMNTLQNKRTYQPADGIVNLAYKDTENYTNVIISSKTPSSSIDITIGSNSGAAKPAFSI